MVTTKANETSVLDNNADIIISGVKVTVYGVSAPALNVSYVKDVNGVTNYTYVTSFDELASFSAKGAGRQLLPHERQERGPHPGHVLRLRPQG